MCQGRILNFILKNICEEYIIKKFSNTFDILKFSIETAGQQGKRFIFKQIL